MRKEICLIEGVDNESYEDFSRRILSLALAVSNKEAVQSVKVNYTKKKPPRISIIPFRKNKIAAVSIYTSGNISCNYLENQPGFKGQYLVEEALPMAYDKNWNDLQETPGECLFTLFCRKKSLNYNTFIDRWHNVHTPLSLKILPLWNYNRNVVTKNLHKNTYQWDGIVEEQVREASQLLNPFKFFGNPLIILYRLLQIYFDTNSFIDYKSMQTYLTSEVWIKS